MFRQRLPTDLRDRVYGLLGLDSSPNALVLYPGYTKSTAEVYEATALELASRNPRFELFSLVERSSSSIIETPSWVPEWTSFREENLFRILNYRLASMYVYNSATDRTASLVSMAPGKASLPGVMVDKIATTVRKKVQYQKTYVWRFTNYRNCWRRAREPQTIITSFRT